MRPGRAVTAGAAMALAMVFSVQQGEHGPLVVYKLEVPGPQAPAAASPPPAAPLYEIPARAPKTLGTVVMPASGVMPSTGWAVPAEAALGAPARPALARPAAAPQRVPQAATLLELLAKPPAGEVASEPGEILTLQQVTDDVSWRRDTVEKLRLIPLAPRF